MIKKPEKTNTISIPLINTPSIIDKRKSWIRILTRYPEQPFSLPILLGLSCLYRFGLYCRERSFDLGWSKTQKLLFPVISVGNITVGGTGKTPIVKMMAEMMLEKGIRPVILSRGYKRKSRDLLLVVSDGNKIISGPKDSGDEPYMLAKWLPEVPVIVCSDRLQAGSFAQERFNFDCFILDDGFQHRQLHRDIDILVINARDPFGHKKLLPYGYLREPLSSLKRASWIFISKILPGQSLSSIYETIRVYNPQAPIIETTYAPSGLVKASDRSCLIPFSSISGKSGVVFSGIAHPEIFLSYLRELGLKLKRSIVFEDHHWFSDKDIEMIKAVARQTRAGLIITTEKDAVRLSNDQKKDLYILTMEVRIRQNDRVFEEKFFRTLLGSHFLGRMDKY